MRLLLGPQQGGLLEPLFAEGLVAAEVASPDAAWQYHLANHEGDRLWVVGTDDWVMQFLLPKWRGLFHLVVIQTHAPLDTLEREAALLVGTSVPKPRLASLLAHAQWRGSRHNTTLRSSDSGQPHWRGPGPIPACLKTETQGRLVNVYPPEQAQWPGLVFNTGEPTSEHIELRANAWRANRIALDAMAHYLEKRHAHIGAL